MTRGSARPRPRSRVAGAVWALLALAALVAAAAVFVTLLATRPVVIVVVVAGSVIVGTLAGVAVWRWRSRAAELPPLTELLMHSGRIARRTGEDENRARQRSRRRAAPSRRGGGALAAGTLALIALIVTATLIAGHRSQPSTRPSVRPLTPALYDATLSFEPSRWEVFETIDVPLPGRRGHPASLSGGWTYAGPGAGGRRAVYARERTIAAQISFWPLRRITNVIYVPRPRLGARTFIAADGSLMHLRGPRRLIGDTTPAVSRRTRISGNKESVELRLTGLRYNPERRHIEVDLANRLARADVYAGAVKYGPYLIGLVITTSVTFFVNRALKRRFGDGTRPVPAPVPAAS